MSILNLKPTHKILKTFYQEINALSELKIDSEGSVAPASVGWVERQRNPPPR